MTGRYYGRSENWVERNLWGKCKYKKSEQMNTYSHCQTMEEKGVARKLTKFVKKRELLISFKPFHSPEASQALSIS